MIVCEDRPRRAAPRQHRRPAGVPLRPRTASLPGCSASLGSTVAVNRGRRPPAADSSRSARIIWCQPASTGSVRWVLAGHHRHRRRPHRGWSAPRSEPERRGPPRYPQQAPAPPPRPPQSVSGWGLGRRRATARPALRHGPQRPRGQPAGGRRSLLLLLVPCLHGSALAEVVPGGRASSQSGSPETRSNPCLAGAHAAPEFLEGAGEVPDIAQRAGSHRYWRIRVSSGAVWRGLRRGRPARVVGGIRGCRWPCRFASPNGG
jgi:hypothetical protein